MAGISRLLNRGSRGGSRVVNTTAVSRPSTRTGNDDLHSALTEAISAVIMRQAQDGDTSGDRSTWSRRTSVVSGHETRTKTIEPVSSDSDEDFVVERKRYYTEIMQSGPSPLIVKGWGLGLIIVL